MITKMRRPARGQAIVLFALSAVGIIMAVGLALDTERLTISYGAAQHAAEAAALAGVEYLPQYPTSASLAPDGNDATDRAVQAAAENGFTDASAITVTPVIGSIPTLQVTIHIAVTLSLSALLTPTPISSAAEAQARILPPVALGDGTGSYGDQPDDVTQMTAAIGSPYELKERGDPYSVQCETGWSDGSDLTHADATTNIYTTSMLGIATNAPQYPGGPQCSPGTPGNPDHVPSGFGGLATRTGAVPTGQSYLVTIPAGGTGYSVWIWNPRFVYPSANSASRLFTTENIYASGYTDNPIFYPEIAYTLFSVPMLHDRTRDVPLAAIWPYATPPNTSPSPALPASQIVTLPPLDTNSGDLWIHGCSSSGAWNLSGGSTYQLPITSGQGCLASVPADVNQWVELGAQTLSAPAGAPAFFRVTVDANAGYGQHDYALKICYNAAFATGCSAAGATVSGWNAATVVMDGGEHQSYPLAAIPAAYAGRQIALGLYNPGVGSGTITLQVIPPAGGGSVTYPTWARTTTVNGAPALETSLSGDNLYHGKWVTLTLVLPPNYTGGTWQIRWDGTVAPPTRMITLRAALIGQAETPASG